VANINRQIAEELGVREQQIEATVTLLDEPISHLDAKLLWPE